MNLKFNFDGCRHSISIKPSDFVSGSMTWHHSTMKSGEELTFGEYDIEENTCGELLSEISDDMDYLRSEFILASGLTKAQLLMNPRDLKGEA